MVKKISENKILENLDADGAHADELSTGPLASIFAYRAFDMRGRFPEPFADFRGALEALQSEIAYLPEMSGEIVAYSRDGRWFEIPTRFFIRRPLRFADREAAEQWVRERQQAIEQGKPGAQLMGYVVARPGDPIEKQIDDALAFRDCRLVGPEENDEICERVARWLADQVNGEW